MTTDGAFVFPVLSDRAKAQMLRQALVVIEAQQRVTGVQGATILRHMLDGGRRHVKMAHYPPGDRIDAETGAQYFYHAHRENLDTEEHGHFHCFLRTQAIPPRIRPSRLPPPRQAAATPMTHIIAIAMNRHSHPIRLFTVNRWVVDDSWYDARHVPALLRRFRFDTAGDSDWNVLDRWVAGMLHLFAPQITWLAAARDRTIEAWQAAHPDRSPYEERQLEELSDIAIDLEHQVALLTGRN